MRKRTKGREELGEGQMKTETERKLSIAVLLLGSSEIFHTVKCWPPAVLLSPMKEIFAQPIFIAYPNFS